MTTNAADSADNAAPQSQTERGTESRIELPAAPADQAEILAAGGVACWSEPLWIDTYEPGAPDPYPLFLDRRVYQGSSGRVYPLPMVDSVSHEKAPRQWQAIHLENAYVRLVLLPEIGGRIHIGYDKVAGYDFFYRNNVIKPALVGLAGPWISGGVEFNWPQHHRPGTFLPVDARIERDDDGSVVVWHSDLDPLQRMRGVHGVRLRPASSLVELEARLHNRTDVVQTFLWWANVAARSHEQYQSFFPDDVAYVADHARRAITAFPQADRPYYGVDYPALAAQRPGADRIDIYSNIPVPTSYMITDTDESFFGGYDHTADAGFVHWADRAVSPGKKMWTWGDGPIGRAWDEQLTDGDGPYVELMAGVYTDNQPDFSWLLPGETKRFSQFWYPIHATGVIRQATTDAAIGIRQTDDDIRVSVISTTARENVQIVVRRGDIDLTTWTADIAPDAPFTGVIDTDDEMGLVVEVIHERKPLLTWRSRLDEEPREEPWVAAAPPQPEEIAGNDELYQTAVHLLQYRHPSRSAEPYLREALRRDPGDARAATALGAWHLNRGEYDEAAAALDVAIERLTRRNLNPRDGEAHYLRGLVAERLGDLAGADRWFAKAAWNVAFAPASALARARLALRGIDGVRDVQAALRLAREAGDIPEAQRLIAVALWHGGEDEASAAEIARLTEADPLDPATRVLRGEPVGLSARAPLDIAAEFARAGAFVFALAASDEVAGGGARVAHGALVDEAAVADEVADAAAEPADAGSADAASATPTTVDVAAPSAPAAGLAGPIVHYLRALWRDRAGALHAAKAERAAAMAAPTDLAFPAGLDQYDALVAAVDANTADHVAAGLLGMWLLDAGRHEEALYHLQQATRDGSPDPVVWRNLAIALVSAADAEPAADAAFVHALRLRDDARLVFERDVLAVRRGLSSAERLALLEQYPHRLGERDDLAVRHITLLLDAGRVDEAWTLLTTRRFRPFEGGEGQVIAAFDRAACLRAEQLLSTRNETEAAKAATLLESGFDIPASMGEGRHPAERPVQRWVMLGRARASAGDEAGARVAWQAAVAPTPLAVAERPADESTFWRGVAFVHLGDDAAAEREWQALDDRAAQLRASRDEVDYFATSLPELALFDVDTATARDEQAAHLEQLAARGRAGDISGTSNAGAPE